MLFNLVRLRYLDVHCTVRLWDINKHYRLKNVSWMKIFGNAYLNYVNHYWQKNSENNVMNCDGLVFDFTSKVRKKSVCCGFLDAGRRYEIPGPETNDLLLMVQHAASTSLFVSVPLALTEQCGRSLETRWTGPEEACICREVDYNRGTLSWRIQICYSGL